jgi:hypothetical protein
VENEMTYDRDATTLTFARCPHSETTIRPKQMPAQEIKDDIAQIYDFHIRCIFFTAGTARALASVHSDPIKGFDLDRARTLDLGEVKKAAAEMLSRLDTGHNETIDRRELTSRLRARELASADPNHDGTLTLDEYLGVVEKRFIAANRDNDGTLNARELRASAGRALLRLLQ